MAHGVGEVLDEENSLVQVLGNKPSPQQAPVHLASQQQHQQQHQQQQQQQQQQPGSRKSVGVMGSRRIFSPSFKLKVLDSYRYDMDCKGNQRATARKYGIHRRQIQKWLQCEESLRKLVTESKQAPTVLPGIVAPASSPNAKDAPAVSPGIHEPQHQHRAPQRPQQQPNNGAPASPSLNPNLARLHGDELAVQQQPPPPPPSAPVAAQALAASHQQVAAAHAAAAAAAAAAAVANYRFHGAATGYPDLKDKVPVAMQPAQYAQGSAADYYELYQAAAAAAAYRHSSPPIPVHHHHHHQHQHQHQQHHQQHQQHNQRYEPDLHRQQLPGSFPAQFEPKVESPEPEQPQRHYAALLAPAEIKSERASPDSLATPVTYETAVLAAQPPKRERLDYDEDHRHEEEQEHSSTCSPVSSHLHSGSIETLPLSPEVSASSDSEMDLPQTEVGCNGSDQIRRRSFPVRFKLEVLDAFHKDAEVAGNQRATARKFRINRRQVQKWLSQENELRGVIELCGNNRQRLGPGCTPDDTIEKKSPKEIVPGDKPVDLTTGALTTELGQISPHSNYNSEFGSSLSPNNYIDSSLTPPYSAPGCSFTCCCQDLTPPRHPYYYCYSPGESAPDGSLKRPHCPQNCCYPQPKKVCYEEKPLPPEKKEPKEPEQLTPLCLVKSKVEPVTSTVPSPPAASGSSPDAKKSAILFKPYLDNPVSKPSESEDASVNNNCQEAWNRNERNVALDVSLRLPNWRSTAPQLSPSQQQPSPPQQQPSPPQQQPSPPQQQPSPPQQQPSPPQQQPSPPQQQPNQQYLEYPQMLSAFTRYPLPSASIHYS